MSRARILDILSRSKHLSDYEDICVLLDQHAGPLEVLFSHYAWLTTEGNAVADAAGGLPPRATSAWGSNKGRAFIASSPVNDSNADIINKHQFWRFVKDANLLSDTLLPGTVTVAAALT